MTIICISGERKGHKGQFTDSPIPGKGSSINDVTKCWKIYNTLSSQWHTFYYRVKVIVLSLLKTQPFPIRSRRQLSTTPKKYLIKQSNQNFTFVLTISVVFGANFKKASKLCFFLQLHTKAPHVHNKISLRPVSWQQQGYCFMLNAEEACRSPRKSAEARRLFPSFFKFCVDFFPPFLTTLDILRWLSAIFVFVFVLFAMQYKVHLGSKKRYHLFWGGA
jgi:hypothetical protein